MLGKRSLAVGSIECQDSLWQNVACTGSRMLSYFVRARPLSARRGMTPMILEAWVKQGTLGQVRRDVYHVMQQTPEL